VPAITVPPNSASSRPDKGASNETAVTPATPITFAKHVLTDLLDRCVYEY